jgi:hypothetical protein
VSQPLVKQVIQSLTGICTPRGATANARIASPVVVGLPFEGIEFGVAVGLGIGLFPEEITLSQLRAYAGIESDPGLFSTLLVSITH